MPTTLLSAEPLIPGGVVRVSGSKQVHIGEGQKGGHGCDGRHALGVGAARNTANTWPEGNGILG